MSLISHDVFTNLNRRGNCFEKGLSEQRNADSKGTRVATHGLQSDGAGPTPRESDRRESSKESRPRQEIVEPNTNTMQATRPVARGQVGVWVSWWCGVRSVVNYVVTGLWDGKRAWERIGDT